MIDLIISATVGAIAGSAIMRRIDLRKMVELRSLVAEADEDSLGVVAVNKGLYAAHSRASDALATLQARIDRALSCETPKAAHGVKKMAAILRGDA